MWLHALAHFEEDNTWKADKVQGINSMHTIITGILNEASRDL